MCVGIMIFHNGINQIIHVIFYTGLFSLVIISALHIIESRSNPRVENQLEISA